MTVLKAEYLGFCNGVALAVKKAEKAVLQAASEGKKIYFYGELVHNVYVSESFLKNGAIVVQKLEDIAEPGYLVVRAHGITDKDRQYCLDHGFTIVDTTCPVVLNGQRLVRESKDPVLIFGYEGHAEVISLLGAAKGEVMVVSKVEDIRTLQSGRKYRGVVQTTFSTVLLETLLKEAEERGIEVAVVNSICSASRQRRKGVSDLKGKVEAFVVVGDKKSANTLELVTIAKSCEVPVYFVDGMEELPKELFSYHTVGLTAGASTPACLYNKVCDQLEGYTL